MMNINKAASTNMASAARGSGRRANWSPFDYWLQHLRVGFKSKTVANAAGAPPPQPDFKNGKGRDPIGPPKGVDTGQGTRTAEMINSAQSKLSDSAKAELEKLREATDGIESLLARQLVDAIQKAAPAFAKGPMASLATETFAQTMSENLAKSSAFGISDALFDRLSETLLRQQEALQDKEL